MPTCWYAYRNPADTTKANETYKTHEADVEFELFNGGSLTQFQNECPIEAEFELRSRLQDNIIYYSIPLNNRNDAFLNCNNDRNNNQLPYCGCDCSGSIQRCFGEKALEELPYSNSSSLYDSEANLQLSLYKFTEPVTFDRNSLADYDKTTQKTNPNYDSANAPIVIQADWREWIDAILTEVRVELSIEKPFEMISWASRSSPDSDSPSRLTNAPSRSESLNSLTVSGSGLVSKSAPSQSIGLAHSNSFPRLPLSALGPLIHQRAKKHSLCGLSYEALAERKKLKNRIAAQRYRNRRSQTLEERRQEIAELASRNGAMRAEQCKLCAQIARFKAAIGLDF